MYFKPQMNGEKSFSKTGAAPLNTSSDEARQLLQNLLDKDYRRQFVAERIYARLPLKIRFLRGDRTQQQIAEKAGKAQTWISKLEDPNYGKFTLATLLDVAAAFDVGLEVDFVPFSYLLDEITNVSQSTFSVPSFEQEAASLFENVQRRSLQTSLSAVPLPSGAGNVPFSTLDVLKKQPQSEVAEMPIAQQGADNYGNISHSVGQISGMGGNYRLESAR